VVLSVLTESRGPEPDTSGKVFRSFLESRPNERTNGAIGHGYGYLVRLVEQMDRTPIRNGDPNLYRLVRKAEDALHSL